MCIHLPFLLLILELPDIFHFEILYHLCSLVCQLNWNRYTNDTCLTLLTITQLKRDFINRLLTQAIILHLVQHDFALLRDDVLALPSEGCEDVKVVFFLCNSNFIDDTTW